MNNVINVLNKQVANWSVLFIKLHNYHWFVKGEQFHALHGHFEGLYNEAAAHIDALAEQTLMCGGAPVATMKEMLELSSIQEATGKEDAKEMLQVIKKDFELLIEELKAGFNVASEAEDEVTAGMLVDIQAGLEKHVWMLNATLS